MTFAELNQLPENDLKEHLRQCCGSTRWVDRMAAEFPMEDTRHLMNAAELIWWELDHHDWLEAFSHHPKIGDIDSLRKRFAATREWAGTEQKGVESASEQILHRLADGNDRYEEKFGYIFIVCATGKTAGQMLELLEDRLDNDPEEEIKIAAGEQNEITKLRLEKLLS